MSIETERIFDDYKNGIWLIDNKKSYVLIQEHEEEKVEYIGGIVLSTNKVEFERGELLRKIVSLNKQAIMPVISYLKTEIRSHRDAMPEFIKEFTIPDSIKRLLTKQGIQTKEWGFAEREEAEIYYRIDRLEELYYQGCLQLVHNNPFETMESFSQNEIDLIIRILLSECSQIYEARSYQLTEVNSYIPEIFQNDELQEMIKVFLCAPQERKEEELNRFVQANIRIMNVYEGGEQYRIVNIRTFSELIALEVNNIMQSPSNYKRCSRCEVCGRLFYKRTGKGRAICNYARLDGTVCINDKYEVYIQEIYHNLRTFIYETGIEATKIYRDFHNKASELAKMYRKLNDFDTFKQELRHYYDSVKEEHSSRYRINNIGHE